MTARIWSETEGRGEDVTLIHGWGMNASVWSEVLSDLRQKYRVTVLDLPGHGNSAELALEGLDDVAEQVRKVLPEKTVLLGWSMGGLIALWLSRQLPDQVRKTLLVCSSPCFVQRDDWRTGLEAGVFDTFAMGLEADYRATLKRFLALQLKGAEEARALLRVLGERLQANPPSREALVKGLGLLNDTDLRSALHGVGGRPAFLLGERDTLVPARLADVLHEIYPEIEVDVLGGAGHMPFLTHPKAFINWLDNKINE